MELPRVQVKGQNNINARKIKTPLFSSIKRKKPKFWGAIVGLRAQITYWALGLDRELSSLRMGEWYWMVQAQDSMSEIQMKGWSKEEYLIGHDKYVSYTCSNDHDNLPGRSIDKDVYHEHLRMMGPQKYLRESCCHRIKCTTATFLAAFMLRRPLNSIALATTTHRKQERVSDGTDT